MSSQVFPQFPFDRKAMPKGAKYVVPHPDHEIIQFYDENCALLGFYDEKSKEMHAQDPDKPVIGIRAPELG